MHEGNLLSSPLYGISIFSEASDRTECSKNGEWPHSMTQTVPIMYYSPIQKPFDDSSSLRYLKI